MLALLDSHPMIGAIPHETGVFHRIEDDEELLRTIESWPEKRGISAPILAEKTPVHARYLERLFRLLPHDRVILMIRDGRDSAVSEAKRLGDFETAVKAWARTLRLALPFQKDSRVLVVKYEELVLRPEDVLREICEFLEIPFREEMLRHSEVERKWWDTTVRPASEDAPLVGENHKRNRNWQINQPLYNAAGRWKDEMTPQEAEIFDRIAGDILIELSYAKNRDWKALL